MYTRHTNTHKHTHQMYIETVAQGRCSTFIPFIECCRHSLSLCVVGDTVILCARFSFDTDMRTCNVLARVRAFLVVRRQTHTHTKQRFKAFRSKGGGVLVRKGCRHIETHNARGADDEWNLRWNPKSHALISTDCTNLYVLCMCTFCLFCYKNYVLYFTANVRDVVA